MGSRRCFLSFPPAAASRSCSPGAFEPTDGVTLADSSGSWTLQADRNSVIKIIGIGFLVFMIAPRVIATAPVDALD
jgi:hypothetical protein